MWGADVTLLPASRCPGSGMQMVARTYVIRHIEPADQDKSTWRIARATERSDLEEPDVIKWHFDEWQREQGQTRDQLACAVCGDPWPTPTAKGPPDHTLVAMSAFPAGTKCGS
jgi:hypothetical protein